MGDKTNCPTNWDTLGQHLLSALQNVSMPRLVTEQ